MRYAQASDDLTSPQSQHSRQCAALSKSGIHRARICPLIDLWIDIRVSQRTEWQRTRSRCKCRGILSPVLRDERSLYSGIPARGVCGPSQISYNAIPFERSCSHPRNDSPQGSNSALIGNRSKDLDRSERSCPPDKHGTTLPIAHV